MDYSTDEIIREFERLFPLEFRVTILTLTNRKQADHIRDQDQLIAGFREASNAEYWENDPSRGDPEPRKK